MNVLLVLITALSVGFGTFSLGRTYEHNQFLQKKLECARTLVYDKDNNGLSIIKFFNLPNSLHSLNVNAIDAYWDYRINKCMEVK